MKKIIALTLFALLLTPAWSANLKTLKDPERERSSWHIEAGKKMAYQNISRDYTVMSYFYVNESFNKNGKDVKSDTVQLNCAGVVSTLKTNELVACKIPPNGKIATVSVSNDAKNGAEGFFEYYWL